MTAWVRVCSNGLGDMDADGGGYSKQRFVFFGGKEFQSTYGFKTINSSPNKQIIGYMPNGEPHVIDNDINSDYPIHVPAPEISKIEMIIQHEVLRRATMEWVCFSWKQLEYMTPYFLIPGISVMIEMGWNHFNPESLVDISNGQKMKDYWDDPYPLYRENIMNSKGNYDVIYGMISNFNWSVEGNNKYVCSTEITSKNRLYTGIPIDAEILDRNDEINQSENKIKSLGNILDFMKKDSNIDNFVLAAKYGPNFEEKVKKEEEKKIVEEWKPKTPVFLRSGFE